MLSAALQENITLCLEIMIFSQRRFMLDEASGHAAHWLKTNQLI